MTAACAHPVITSPNRPAIPSVSAVSVDTESAHIGAGAGHAGPADSIGAWIFNGGI
jgi:hypothetical protein